MVLRTMRKHAAIHADEKQLWADALRGSIAHVKLPFLELVRCKAAVCAEAVGVLDEAALPCARRSCDEAWCAGANLMSSMQFSCWSTQCWYAQGTQSWNRCMRSALLRSGLRRLRVWQRHMPTGESKADVVIDIRSVVCGCRLTDPIQSLGDPVCDLQVGP